MIDSYWFTGTVPLWTFVALVYCFASVYLRAFDSQDHRLWVWFPFMIVGTMIFLVINRSHIWGPETHVSLYIEYMTVLTLIIACVTMVMLAKQYAKERGARERLEEEIAQRSEELTYEDSADTSNDGT